MAKSEIMQRSNGAWRVIVDGKTVGDMLPTAEAIALARSKGTLWRARSPSGEVLSIPGVPVPQSGGKGAPVGGGVPGGGAAPSSFDLSPVASAAPVGGASLQGADDPYEAFNARFLQEFGRPITQAELNDNKALVQDLGISNDLFRLLPFDRQMGFPSSRIAQLDNADEMKLIEFNPQIANDFPTSHWKTFSNDWLAKTLGPFFSKNNPAEWNNIVNQNKIGGENAGGLPPELRPDPNAKPQGSAVPGNAGSQPAPVAGAPTGAVAGGAREPLARIGELNAPVSRDALDIFYSLGGINAPVGGSTLQGATPIGGGAPDGAPYTGAGGEQIPGPELPDGGAPVGPPPNVPTDQQWVLNPNFDPNAKEHPALNPRYIENKFYRAPSAASTGGAATYASVAYQRERDEIDREIREAERAADAAERAGNREEAARQFDVVQDLRERQFSLDRQTQAEQTAEGARQFDTTSSGYDAQGNPTLGRENITAENDRQNLASRVSAATQAANIALRQGDQAEAKRQFDIAQSFSQQIAIYDREQQQRRDPGSFLDKVSAARGGGAVDAAPVGLDYTIGAGGAYQAPQRAPVAAPAAAPVGGAFPDFPTWLAQNPGKTYDDYFAARNAGGGATSGVRTLSAAPVAQGPLTANEIIGNTATPWAIRQTFGGGGRVGTALGGNTGFAPISAQDEGDLTDMENQALDAAVLATGDDPNAYRKRGRALSRGSFGQPKSYAPVR